MANLGLRSTDGDCPANVGTSKILTHRGVLTLQRDMKDVSIGKKVKMSEATFATDCGTLQTSGLGYFVKTTRVNYDAGAPPHCPCPVPVVAALQPLAASQRRKSINRPEARRTRSSSRSSSTATSTRARWLVPVSSARPAAPLATERRSASALDGLVRARRHEP